MKYIVDFSIIIPVWRGALKYLPQLLNSIPSDDRIEIIVVDNSIDPIVREEIETEREIILLHSEHERHAGGSRNDGMKAAKGKWLIFADADDYFVSDAFNSFFDISRIEAEIVFFKPEGIFADTGEHSSRGDYYANLVHRYCIGEISEDSLRLHFASPWCKMIKHDLVDRHSLKFDEIRASNDMYFSVTSGYYAKSIAAIDKIVYILRVTPGSLTQHRDFEVIRARLYGTVHRNQFLREHKKGVHQESVMYKLYASRPFPLRQKWELVKLIYRFRQNPFIGWKNWLKSVHEVKKTENINKKYIVK